MPENFTLLIVEDSQPEAEFSEETLKAAGLRPSVTFVRNRTEVERALTERAYDIIISDYRMSSFTGKDVVELASRLCPGTPVIIVTGSLSDETAVDLLKSGAADYVLKDRLASLPDSVERALKEKEEKDKLEKASRALTESEERYRDLFENTSDLILTVSPDGRILYANKAVKHTLGYEQAELFKIPFFDLLSPSTRESAREYFSRIIQGKKNAKSEFTLLSKSGGKVLAEGSCHLKTKENKPRYLQCIFRDVTEQKELESRFFQAQKMDAIGRLAGGIAHDFNNILGAIEGYATLILNGMAATDPVRPDIEEIRKAEQRAAALTKQLMAFSRSHSARKKNIELTGLIAELEKMAKRLIGEDITLEVSSAPDLRPVQADAGQLEQVLINLLVNARDAMPRGGLIKVITTNADLSDAERKCPEPVEPGRKFIKISVADSGTGMDKATLAHLFEPFFTTKPKGKGTGLGLSTVYGLVKQHNGWIDVNSEEGKGSVFTVYLPQAPDGTVTAASPGAAARDLHGNGEKVLVVEDDEALRKLTARMLKENGYDPVEAGTAAEAISIFSGKNADFSIIFADMVLGDRNGIELINDIQKAARRTDFVFTSGYLNDKINLEFVRSKGYTFIPKPYSIETVLTVFKEMLSPKKST